jgi:hypothetical protein
MAESNKERRKHHAHEGLTRELGIKRDTFDSDPSRGVSRGYPSLWLRLDIIEQVQQIGLAAASAIVKPSLVGGRRTERTEPHEMHGDRERTKLVGRDQTLGA